MHSIFVHVMKVLGSVGDLRTSCVCVCVCVCVFVCVSVCGYWRTQTLSHCYMYVYI